jgi:ABC-type nitrate/sulfonate/bicarbonate transport system permease component
VSGARVAAGGWTAVRWLVGHLWAPALLVLAWHLWVDARDFNPIVIPRPGMVFDDLTSSPGAYVGDVLTTLRVAAIGLTVGLLLGTVGAILAWSSSLLSGLVTPAAITLHAVPTVALIPVVARVFGYDARTVVAIAVLISFFPAFVFVSSGLRQLPAGSALLFDALGSDRRTRLWRLAVPAAVPNVFVALRMSAATCVIAAVVAEYLMGTEGLGQAFAHSYTNYEMDRAFGIAIVVMARSLALFSAASAAERWGRTRWT